MRVGITGNIGCGKSTFTKILAGILTEFRHVDVDKLVDELYLNPTFCTALKARFNTSERKEVSDIVFADPHARKWLEEQSSQYMSSMMARTTVHGKVLVEFPLLYEMDAQHGYDQVVTVYCDEALQMQRVRARDNISEAKIKSIVGAQMSTKLKTILADHTIDTGTEMSDLEGKAYALAAKLRVGMLRERFISKFATDDNSCYRIWDAVIAAYTEPHRKYHTLEHLAYLFYQFDKIRHLLKYPEIVEQAIWFHDFVYQTEVISEYKENEANSVKAMFDLYTKNHARLGYRPIDVPFLAVAGEFILATKGHAITSPYLLANPALKHDCEIFLDLDLSVLFSDAHTLKAFDAGVREEFSSYGIEEFAKGRVAALQAFLDRPQVLYSTVFAEQEPQARCSLERLINYWHEFILN